MFLYTVDKLQPKIQAKGKPGKYQGPLFSIDSTTIDLCYAAFPWAKFHHKKGAVKIHTVLNHDGLLPVFADITHGRVHDKEALRTTLLDSKRFPKDSVVAMDRAYNDYSLFSQLTDRNIWFVTRQKENAVYNTIENHKIPSGRNIISDETIELTSLSRQRCEYYLRRVVVWDDAKNREIVFLSNNLKFGASTISGL